MQASPMPTVPKNSETHFNVVVVSDAFANKPVIQRHRYVHTSALGGAVHELHCMMTPE